MGKEAKFGLAVIVVLLITFGVVLADRLKGTSDEKPTASSKEKKKGAPLAALQSTPKDATGGKPAVVDTKPPLAGTGSSMPGGWGVASDTDATTSTLQTPPSSSYIMPDPSTAAADDRYNPYAGSSRYESYGSTSPQQTTGTGTQGTGSASDPLYDRSSLGGTTSNTDNILRPPPTSPSPPSGLGPATRPSMSPYNSPYSSSQPYSPYSSGSSTLPSPPTTQGSPYQSPAPTKSGSVYGASAVPISTYGSSNPPNENGQYEVQPNDSYWKISQKLYGSGAYFKALVEQNRAQIPREDRLAVGDLISAPTISELEKAYPDLCPKPSRREAVRNMAQAVSMRSSSYGGGPTYVVESGDTLFDIARYELGKSSRWAEIYELNRNILGKDYDYLVPGTRLTLPGNKAADTITSRPGNGLTYQR